MRIYEGLTGIPPIKSPVVTSGTFDGVHLGVANKTLIFAKQENYSVDIDLAWQRFSSWFDEEGFDSANFDEIELVPGYFDPTNERSGVYKILVDSSNIVTLELQQTVDTDERVDVAIGGLDYGGKRLFYDPSVKTGNTVPDYSILSDEALTDQTTFDGNGTRFFLYKDTYEVPDVNDSYIKWPQLGVFE